jgi:hypothetical protein
VKHGLRQQLVGHPDEFGHAQINTANTRQDVTQGMIENALHRGQQDFHQEQYQE